MKSFVIIFRQGPPALNPAELAQRQREVSAWVRENNTPERKLEPRILTPDVARPNGDDGVGDGAWPITAFLFIEAHDLDEAATIAASHPAKHFRARVEVRPWAPPAVPASSQPPR